jgi:hypothetical protein
VGRAARRFVSPSTGLEAPRAGSSPRAGHCFGFGQGRGFVPQRGFTFIFNSSFSEASSKSLSGSFRSLLLT